MGDFTKLKVWQKAHELTIRVYALTKKLPKDEDYVLKPQSRRAAVSVESNIAEGETRYTEPAKINFFVDARSSAAEVQSQMRIVRDVYPNLFQEAIEIIEEYEILAKQLNSLITFRRKNHLITQKPNSPMT